MLGGGIRMNFHCSKRFTNYSIFFQYLKQVPLFYKTTNLTAKKTFTAPTIKQYITSSGTSVLSRKKYDINRDNSLSEIKFVT